MGKGSVSISNECIALIRATIPSGSTILEMGSGAGTIQLSEHFKMYSVEHVPEWQNKFPLCTTYINCRIKMYDDEYTAPDISNNRGWYNPSDLEPNLPESYDLILIDGPGGYHGRAGFLKHIEMFNTNVPIVFDDINRKPDFDHMISVAAYLNKPYEILTTDDAVGIIR